MEKSAYKNMWVYIEHDKKTVAPVSLELCCEARKLCDVTGEKLVAVILGELPEEDAEPEIPEIDFSTLSVAISAESDVVELGGDMVLTAVLTALALALLDPMLAWINVTPASGEVYRAAYTYCAILFGGIGAQLFYNFICSFLRSMGDSVTPLAFLLFSTVLTWLQGWGEKKLNVYEKREAL